MADYRWAGDIYCDMLLVGIYVMMALLLEITLYVALLSILTLAGLGLYTVFYWIKAPNSPADTSNRLNNIQSWHIGLRRPEVLASSYKFFRNDVLDNIKDVEKSDG